MPALRVEPGVLAGFGRERPTGQAGAAPSVGLPIPLAADRRARFSEPLGKALAQPQITEPVPAIALSLDHDPAPTALDLDALPPVEFGISSSAAATAGGASSPARIRPSRAFASKAGVEAPDARHADVVLLVHRCRLPLSTIGPRTLALAPNRGGALTSIRISGRSTSSSPNGRSVS
jgi:hypothetical protein